MLESRCSPSLRPTTAVSMVDRFVAVALGLPLVVTALLELELVAATVVPSEGILETQDVAISVSLGSLVPRPFSYAHAREGKEGSGK